MSIILAKHFYQQGIEKVTENNLNDAIKDFNQAIALESDFIEAYENRSLANLG
jgi:outer membrane protein assembly factor BamD (BamD/ComL family)